MWVYFEFNRVWFVDSLDKPDWKYDLQVVSLAEADMDKDIREELHLIVNACYKLWIKKSKKLQEESGRKYGEMLYRRFSERWDGPFF